MNNANIFHNTDLSELSFLVSGGAGFIGGHIAEYLLINGAKKVRIIDNLVNGFHSNIDILNQYPAFEFQEGDIRNLEDCQLACKGIDYVSHQAALGSVPRSIKEPFYTNDVNVGGFVNMMKAAVDNHVKQFVYASSSSVYGDEPNLPKKEDRIGNCLSPYAVSKRTNELYAEVFSRVYGLPVLGFRYFNIFGPRQDPDGPYAAVIPLFVKGILNKTQVFINGDGEQTRDFTFVQNAVQINIKGMLAKDPGTHNKIYNVAIGEKFSVNFLYKAIQTYLQSNHQPTYRAQRDGDVVHSLADISLAKELLGYQPVVEFAAGLKETIEFFKTKYERELI